MLALPQLLWSGYTYNLRHKPAPAPGCGGGAPFWPVSQTTSFGLFTDHQNLKFTDDRETREVLKLASMAPVAYGLGKAIRRSCCKRERSERRGCGGTAPPLDCPKAHSCCSTLSAVLHLTYRAGKAHMRVLNRRRGHKIARALGSGGMRPIWPHTKGLEVQPGTRARVLKRAIAISCPLR